MGSTVELEWGLKTSFLAYVSRLPDGYTAVDGPAEFDGALFSLPGRLTRPDEWRFDGTLRFYGHAGVLNVELSDIRVEQVGETGDAGRITVSVSGVRMPLAEFSEPESDAGGATTYRTVSLTDDGAAVLGGVYLPGTSADPVTIRATS